MDTIQIQCKKLGLLSYEMTVHISSQEIQKAFNQGYRKFQRKVSLPGFRKGKIPVDYIRKNYFSDVQQDVLKSLVEKAYLSGLQESKLDPAGSPRFNFKPIQEAEDFHFKARFEIHPEVEVKNYENLHIKAKKSVPSLKDVDQSIEDLRKSAEKIIPIKEDHPCQKDNVVSIDLSGNVEGGHRLPLEKDVLVELGKGLIFKEIEESLIGLKINDQKQVQIQFPKENKEFPNKKVTFDILLKKISKKVRPELNDKWAQTFQVKNVEELRKKVLKHLENQMIQSYQEELRNKALEQLIEQNPLELPESVVKAQQVHLIEATQNRLKTQGISEDQFKKYIKDHSKDLLKKSQWNAHAGYIIKALAQTLKLEETPEETKAYIQQHWNKKSEPDSSLLESVRWQRIQLKVLDFIVQKAKIEEPQLA